MILDRLRSVLLPALELRLLESLLSKKFGAAVWLLQLRWLAVLGQLMTIFVAYFLLEVRLPLSQLLSLIGLTAATNIAFGWWLRRDAAWSDEDQTSGTWSSYLMLLDLFTLTGMLYLTGGVTNPFSLFYFVNLAVGGVILRPVWAWSLTALAVLGYGVLIRWHRPVETLATGDLQLTEWVPTIGLFVAFATCAPVVTLFVTQIAAELTLHQQRLRQSEADRVRSRQLEGLTTLAAGAAHELATPLATIDIIVRELGRHLAACATPPTVNNDLGLIESELETCRQILMRMRAAAGDQSGQSWQVTTVEDLIDVTLEGVRDPHRVEVIDGPESVEQQRLWLPREAVAQAIRNLIHNGLDAGGADGHVQLATHIEGTDLWISIRDHGSGMSNEQIRRAGEPFFTTKEPGLGMGLGLFLTRNVIQRLEGEIVLESKVGQGTMVQVRLPLASESTDA